MSDRNYLPWWRLDNAAKIFPSTSSAHDSKVFRFFCELEEAVEPAALQSALDRTMERFPIYRCVLRRGWFWYYLEDSPLPAAAPAVPRALLPQADQPGDLPCFVRWGRGAGLSAGPGL